MHMHMRFEWDQNKARDNFRKHRISFEDAAEALTIGPVLLEREDASNDEQRFVLDFGF